MSEITDRYSNRVKKIEEDLLSFYLDLSSDHEDLEGRPECQQNVSDILEAIRDALDGVYTANAICKPNNGEKKE